LNAKIVNFNGWALPVQFDGIVQEHLHTRSTASMFDCSHMGEYRFKGADAVERFGREVISDPSKIPVGRCRYGAILNESGGILDDLITFRMSEDELYVVTNAGPIESVTERFCADNPGSEHVSYATAKIDIQGPASREHLLSAGFEATESLKYFNCLWTTWRGHEILLSRTGYTGELGYELFMANELAEEVWDVFHTTDGIRPAGLGARDTLRTEVGYALSGQDFDESVTPLEAGMEGFVAWDTDFVGKSALEAKREAGGPRYFVAVRTRSRRAPRHGFEIKGGGNVVGAVTSGTFGPSLGEGVGLARVDGEYASAGAKLSAGPKNIELEVADIPIFKDGSCRVKV
ncbi:MAG: glycine cleavage system aminomethyltransferase GcvT, partial [Candidatus Hydrogenedentes bacterium]|nr:glycine cleavage system aminomethyltransferase GcvT [Candidatus Hydrogenedentota bacterium]